MSKIQIVYFLSIVLRVAPSPSSSVSSLDSLTSCSTTPLETNLSVSNQWVKSIRSVDVMIRIASQIVLSSVLDPSLSTSLWSCGDLHSLVAGSTNSTLSSDHLPRLSSFPRIHHVISCSLTKSMLVASRLGVLRSFCDSILAQPQWSDSAVQPVEIEQAATVLHVRVNQLDHLLQKGSEHPIASLQSLVCDRLDSLRRSFKADDSHESQHLLRILASSSVSTTAS